MKYCLFCRDSFEDDMKTCPTCSGPLIDELPDEEDDTDESPKSGCEMEGNLVSVLIVRNEDDLRVATEVLAEHGIDFEIDQADNSKRFTGEMTGRAAWKLMVKPDEGPEAFLRLATALPGLFPHEVSEALEREKEEHPDQSRLAASRIVDSLESKGPEMLGPELAKNIIVAFGGDDHGGIAKAQYALARRGKEFAPLLSEIAAQAVAEGGEGSERVLYNVLEILEAIGDGQALEKIKPLLDSPTAQVRARAAYAAGRLGTPAAVDSLIALLSDGDEEVRYEASEAIWRLTGLDFDFDPYLPIEEEKQHVEALREAWERSGKKGIVRNRVDLASLLEALAGEG